MCRILAAKYQNNTSPLQHIKAFSSMAQKSKAPDGDWQGDGWGIAWRNQNNTWQQYTSLKPIWQDQEMFSKIPPTNFLAIHARSASFPQHKDIIEFNQPFIQNDTAFLFNGIIRKVTFPYSLPGRIGSQKLHALYHKLRPSYSPQETLKQIKSLLKQHAQEIQACNITVIDEDNLHALSMFTSNPQYYALRYYQTSEYMIISSEELNNLPTPAIMSSEEIITL